MPFGMSDYIQSIVVQGRVYVGGGFAFGKHGIVMEYNTSSEKWAQLPQYQARFFGMTAFNNQLVLVAVGGWDTNRYGKVLGVWGADSREWTHPYPEMPTARSGCSAVVYKEWLIVAGGVSGGGRKVSSVEVMNIDTKQWHTGQPTPTPWDSMKTAIVGDMCYFMGGCTSTSGYPGTDSVYCVSLPALISQAQTREHSHIEWKEKRRQGIAQSAPLSISGSLLAIGGRDITSYKGVTTIHLYQPDTGKCVKVGDLPTPRSTCTCAMITDREILVAGGGKTSKTLDLALIPCVQPNYWAAMHYTTTKLEDLAL